MIHLDDLIIANVECLREIGALRGDIDFLSPALSRWYSTIDNALAPMNHKEMMDRARAMISNSNNSVIIDLGSEIGDNLGGLLGKEKPRAQVILINKPWKIDNKPDYLFTDYGRGMERVIFKHGRDKFDPNDMVETTNMLYRENGYHNVKLIGHEMKIEEGVPTFLNSVRGRDIYIFGRRAPVNLPLISTILYNKLNAKYVFVSATALEKIPLDNPIWDIVGKNLPLKETELAMLKTAVNDPKVKAGSREVSKKYDYEKPEQKMAGIMLKLALVLSLAKEIRGTIYKDNDHYSHDNYDQFSHYFEGIRP